MVSHYHTMLGGHWSSAKGDFKKLICKVTSQKYVIQGSCNFMNWSSSLSVLTVTRLRSLLALDIVAVET